MIICSFFDVCFALQVISASLLPIARSRFWNQTLHLIFLRQLCDSPACLSLVDSFISNVTLKNVSYVAARAAYLPSYSIDFGLVAIAILLNTVLLSVWVLAFCLAASKGELSWLWTTLLFTILFICCIQIAFFATCGVGISSSRAQDAYFVLVVPFVVNALLLLLVAGLSSSILLSISEKLFDSHAAHVIGARIVPIIWGLVSVACLSLMIVALSLSDAWLLIMTHLLFSAFGLLFATVVISFSVGLLVRVRQESESVSQKQAVVSFVVGAVLFIAFVMQVTLFVLDMNMAIPEYVSIGTENVAPTFIGVSATFVYYFLAMRMRII